MLLHTPGAVLSTAIALLFAILKVRSAPFVILDEVEAALDEANVIRYAQFLNDLSQFVNNTLLKWK